MEHEALNVLSVRQPWAELIVRGEKTVEYRSQQTKIRVRVYVYASATKPDLTDREIRQEVGQSWNDLAKGVLVGTVEIIDCIGNDGQYEWILANPEQLDEPLKPTAQPNPVWFYPFGAPSEFVGDESSDDEADQPLDDDARPSTTRFAPVIAASATPPFTPYHSKYFATRRHLARSIPVATATRSP
jgi:hypothetical protein